MKKLKDFILRTLRYTFYLSFKFNLFFGFIPILASIGAGNFYILLYWIIFVFVSFFIIMIYMNIRELFMK
jgi:hypothetical protein